MVLETLQYLYQWGPSLLTGLLHNIKISVTAIMLGSIMGFVIAGINATPAHYIAKLWVQLFRNSPWLVLVYLTTYLFPFEIKFGTSYIQFPDWLKVTVGLALPASANVAEFLRGAVASIPATQWEAAKSLALTRLEMFRLVILPQCIRRMLPSWMNLYSLITMGTALSSLVGVHDILSMAQIATNTVNRIPFTVVVYLLIMVLFFLWCYPISRVTQRLENRYAFS